MKPIKAEWKASPCSRVASTLLLVRPYPRSVLLTTPEEEIDLQPLAAQLEALMPDPAPQFYAEPAWFKRPQAASAALQCQASIIVVQSGQSRNEAVLRLQKELESCDAKPLGIVLVESRNPIPWFIRKIAGVS